MYAIRSYYETLVADILSAPRDAGRRMPSWMAIAAGLVIATGVFLSYNFV